MWDALLGDVDASYSPYAASYSPYAAAGSGLWDASGTEQAAPYATDPSPHGWPAGAGDAEDAALQAALQASLAEGAGDVDAPSLAAALRQQQELLQRQWSAAGQTAAPPAAPEPSWEPAVPTPEASVQPVWEPRAYVKAGPVVDAPAPVAAEPAFEPFPQFERQLAPEEEVDDLLALMGIS